jgi:hypothetical protein
MNNIPDFEIYTWGLVFMSLCAISDMPVDAIEKRANFEQPTGLTHGWSLHDAPFKDGSPNPRPCDRHPETHRHYLLSC